MNTPISRLPAVTACAIALVTAAGCSHLPPSGINSVALASGSEHTLVIGKLRLVKNDAEVNLGNGLLANNAVIHVYDKDRMQRFSADVGPNGEFTWALKPGNYQLSGIDFMVRGQRMNIDSRFEFETNASGDATYIGTITLQTSFESGYYGVSGSIDNYSIVDDCSTDCDGILARIGRPAGSAEVSLVRANQQLLSQRQPSTKATSE